MTKTPDVVSQEIRNKLAVTAPGFSLELGTPERKMLDAVAEAIYAKLHPVVAQPLPTPHR